MAGVRLAVDQRSAAEARRLLLAAFAAYADRSDADALRRVRDDVLADAQLAVSELVTNAVRHARTLLLLDVEVTGSVVHVAVTDDGEGLPVVRLPAADAVGGRGLRIVDDVTDRWGIESDADVKRVWFEIALR